MDEEKTKDGKIKVIPTIKIKNNQELARYYTPGVKKLVEQIMNNENNINKTFKKKAVLLISNGSAVLGYGNIGHKPMLAVLEAKALLLSNFSSLSPFPITVEGTAYDISEIVRKIKDSFSAVMIEDVKSPECFYLQQELSDINIPVFNDDMYGSAITVSAALLKSIRKAGKDKKAKIIISGAGAAGLTTALLLKKLGFNNIYVYDSKGLLDEEREDLNVFKKKVAFLFKKKGKSLKEELKNADVFIGLSKGGLLKKEDIEKMRNKAIVFALANPKPEIDEKEALKAKNIYIYASGNSTSKNWINNALVFPSILEGLVKAQAKRFKEEYAIEIAKWLSKYPSKTLLPSLFNKTFRKQLAYFVEKIAKTN